LKLPEALQIAIQTNNGAMAGHVVDQLRAKCGYNYQRVYDLAKKLVPSLTIADWESLMYEADAQERYEERDE
jgi:hypothetical protein